MNLPRSSVACLLGVALLCGSTRGENDPAPIPFPPALHGLTNLCLSASAPTFAGSLGAGMSDAVAAGMEPRLQQIRVPPQDLVVRWPFPVTIGAHVLAWESAEVHGIWFGLEYWDITSQRFVRLYEIRDNQSANTLREFPPITTTEIRFTVFDHVLRYNSVVIRQFALFGAPAKVGGKP